ncbi:hypothetical protein Scep_001245 [Stephania cephalantha]|uniref:Uncharacterized protein n=1 Tax=Stephania cephalantha TaxID=152367 RepID=A0AAP0LBE4_9MAGN
MATQAADRFPRSAIELAFSRQRLSSRDHVRSTRAILAFSASQMPCADRHSRDRDQIQPLICGIRLNHRGPNPIGEMKMRLAYCFITASSHLLLLLVFFCDFSIRFFFMELCPLGAIHKRLRRDRVFAEREDALVLVFVVGWSGDDGALVIKRYYLGDTNPSQVYPDQGELPIVPNSSAIKLQSSRLYIAFQLNTTQPPSRVLYYVGPRDVLPSSNNRLTSIEIRSLSA